MNGMPSVRHSSAYCSIAAGIVRRDDRQRRSRPTVAERQLAGIRHRAGVERRDLVVVDVGAAEERRRELARHVAHERRVHARRLEPAAGSRRSPARPSPSAAAARRAAPAYRRCSGAHPPRRLSIVSTRKLRLTRCTCSGSRCSVNLPGKRHQVVERDRTGDDDVHDSDCCASGSRLRARGPDAGRGQAQADGPAERADERCRSHQPHAIDFEVLADDRRQFLLDRRPGRHRAA